MRLKEGLQIEYKREVAESIIKDVIAFANTEGGTLYIGVEDNGHVVGVENLAQAYDTVTSMIKSNIYPDTFLIVKAKIITLEQKEVIAITVQRGPEKPYYRKSKGPTPKGIYVRDGARSIEASQAMITKMFVDYQRPQFEEGISRNQKLSFREAKALFKEQEKPLETNHMRTLKILNREDQYTNLALLLSDQCPFVIRVSRIQGETRGGVVESQKEIGGSVFAQFQGAYSFAESYNYTRSSYQDIYRQDTPNYPEFALREGIINSIVHRDYSSPNAANFLTVYDSQIEITSYGGLVEGIDTQDIIKGYSQPRNRGLCHIFLMLGLMEQYGYGIPRIFSQYQEFSTSPRIETSPNVFRLYLPNQNFIISPELSPEEQQVLEYIQRQGSITRAQTETLLQVSKTTALNLLNALEERKIIEVTGVGRATRYLQK